MFTKHKPHAGHNVDHTLHALSMHFHHPRQRRNGPVCWCMTLCYFQWARYSAFFLGDLNLWPLTLTFKLIRERERSNTFSLWIWRKSVLRFPRYFIQKQKVTAPKTEPYAAVISG